LEPFFLEAFFFLAYTILGRTTNIQSAPATIRGSASKEKKEGGTGKHQRGQNDGRRGRKAGQRRGDERR
jgi:hypothetical protein